MSFILSSNMNLPIPTVGQEAGPQYAFDVNTSLSLIDSHDHTPGRGVQITPAGININVPLDFHGNSAFDLLELTLLSQTMASAVPITISAAPGGGTGLSDLWYTDGTGTPIQITQSGAVKVTASSITGVTYAAGTFYFTQTVDALPTNPANLAAGFVTVSPNNISDSPPTIGVTIQPNAAQVGLSNFVLPILPSVPSFLTIDNSGNVSATPTLASFTNSLPSNAGAQGYFLRQGVTGQPIWQTLDSIIAAVTTTYSIRTIDDIVQVSGSSFTATLPTAVGFGGKEYTILKTDASLANIITLKGNGSETIGSFGNTVTLSTQNETWIIYSDNTNWQVKAHNTVTPTITDTNVIISTGSFGVTSVTATFGSSASTITVSSSANLLVGMPIVDISTPGNFQANTLITSIVGTAVGISRPTLGASAGGPGDTIHNVPAYWRWHREGAYMVGQFILLQTVAGTAGSGDYRLTVPSGQSIDLNVANASTQTDAILAIGRSALDSTCNVTNHAGVTPQYSGQLCVVDSSHVRMIGQLYDQGNTLVVVSEIWNQNLSISNTIVQATFSFKAPISGWQP